MFGGKLSDDDDDIFSPKASSNLANLFGISMQSNEDKENPSLIYTAPKQSTKNPQLAAQRSDTAAQQKAPQSSIVLAKRVHCYKFENNKYLSRGLHGLAIIEDSNQKRKFVIYKDKQNIICSTQIIKTLTIKIPDGKYCHFSDDMQINWSILFESNDDLNAFLNELRKSNVNIEIKNITECKSDGDGDAVTPAVLELKSDTISDTIENTSVKNVEEVNIAKSNDATKEKIISLMEKMGQSKLLPKLPSTTDVSDSSDTESIHNKKPTRKCVKPVVSQRKNDSFKNDMKPIVNTSSAVPALVNQSNVQYALINGQLVPILQPNQPFLSNANTNILPNTPFDHQMVMSSYGMQQQMYQPVQSSPDINIFLAENRTHNSEVRMNITKLEQKLEKVLEKIEYIKVSPENIKRPIPKERSMNKEQPQGTNFESNEILIRQIQILENENKVLQEKLDSYEMYETDETNTKLQNYEQKIMLLEKTLAELEKSNEIEMLKKQNEYSFKIKDLEEVIADLNNKLIDFEMLSDKIQSLERDNQEYISRISEYEERVQELSGELQNEVSLSNKQSGTLESIDESTSQSQSQISEYESQISDLKIRLRETQTSCSHLNRSVAIFEATLKSVMNSVYQTLNDSFSRFKCHPEMMPLLKETIRTATREALVNFKTDFVAENCTSQTDNAAERGISINKACQNPVTLRRTGKRETDSGPYLPPYDGI